MGRSLAAVSQHNQLRCKQTHLLGKLHFEGILFGLMRYLIQLGFHEQLALSLARIFLRGHEYRVPRSKGQDRRGQTPDMVSIYLRPPELEARQFPGHWQGDVLKGADNASAVGTLVERTSRLLMLILVLIKLPEFKPASAANVMQMAFSDKLLGIAEPMRKSMT